MSHVIKAVIFDLDGVLLESRDMHWRALNDALETVSKEHVISHELHEKQFNGLPTKVKLNILTEQYGLSKDMHHQIETLKQVHTIQWIMNNVKSDKKLRDIFSSLKAVNIKTGIASNSVKATVDAFVLSCGLSTDMIDTLLSNEDVRLSKPNGEIYTTSAKLCNVSTNELLAVEDSHVGCAAALTSGANVLHVTGPEQLTLWNVIRAIQMVESSDDITSPMILMPHVKFKGSPVPGIVSSSIFSEDCTYIATLTNVDRLTIVEELNSMRRLNLTEMITHNAIYTVS